LPNLGLSTLAGRCQLLRSLHQQGRPLLLPNAWDVASATAVVDAGFPVVATSSRAVAATLGYQDHEQAPAAAMLAIAERIAATLAVPVTVDAEAGYGMPAPELVETLASIGAAGCNLEDTNHHQGGLRDPPQQADWLSEVRAAAAEQSYPLVINARIDVFITDRASAQADLLPDAIERARAYLAAGCDCVYPIFLHEQGALVDFVREVAGPVNVLAQPQAPPLKQLADLGVARISYAAALHRQTMEHLAATLTNIAQTAPI
jgi:2-methylisocitrate lyase-like PEP mutase family enzyme